METSRTPAPRSSAARQRPRVWNIHARRFGGGEIRGFPTLVPEPTTLGLAGLGLLALG